MHLQTLGGLALAGSSFRRPKPLLLLTYLALEGPRDRRFLSELFWPDAAEPMSSLRVALSQLRKAAPDALEVGDLQIDAKVEVDALRLLEALERGEEQLLDSYPGAFLAGFYLPDLGSELEEWIYATREFLAERVRDAVLELAERAAASGDFQGAAQRAEQAWALPGAAAPEPEQLGRIYRLLVAGDSLKAAQLQQEAQAYGIALKLERAEARRTCRPERASGARPPTNLPSRRSSFVGRDPELLELAGLLADEGTRLITLTGAGGVGKSRLALQAGYEALRQQVFPDGVYFTALETLSEPEQIPVAVAGALGLRLSGREDPLEEVLAHLRDQRLLLILDNYEHLVRGARLTADLLESCPDLKLLVTSRERLNVAGEQLFALEGLPLPSGRMRDAGEAAYQDAVRLFVQRAKRVRLEFALSDENLPHVLAICRLVQGLPLGIELAAAWVRLLSPQEIAAQIAESLDFLSAATRDAAARQQSLRATFDYSWTLLSPKEQETLRKLSVFVGGFGREAASQVAGATIPLLASLSDKSLLRVVSGGRYDRHPLLYQYTQEKLAEHPGEAQEAKAKHAAYFLAFAEEAEQQLKGAEQAHWLRCLEDEHDNLRAALRHARESDATLGLRIAGALWQFWLVRGHLDEARAWYQALLALPGAAAPTLERAKALSGAGTVAFAQGDYAASQAFHEEALALRRQHAYAWGIAASLYNLGGVHAVRQDYAAARPLFEESVSHFRALGNEWSVAVGLNNLGALLSLEGDAAAARACYQEGLGLRRKLGDRLGEAETLGRLGTLAHREGDDLLALTLFRERLRLEQEVGEKSSIPESLAALASLLAERGEWSPATCLWGAAQQLRETFGAALQADKRRAHEQELAAGRAQLGERTFAAAWNRGWGLTFEEAVAFALEATERLAQEPS